MAQALFSSLRMRLVALVLLAVIPALALVLYTGIQQRQMAVADVQQEVLRLTRLTAGSQERLVAGTRPLLVTLAQLPQLRQADIEACQALLTHLLKQYPIYTNLGVIGLDGQVFCSGIPLNRPVNVADRPYFQQALQTRDFTTGEYQIGRITGKAGLNFAYPILNETGQAQAVVFAALDLAWFSQLMTENQFPAEAVLTVIDRQGTILARYPDSGQWVGQPLPEASLVKRVLAQGEGTTQGNGADKVARLYAYMPLADASNVGAGTYIIVEVPTATAFARVDQIMTEELVGLGLVGLVGLAAAWFGSNLFLVRPLKALVEATQRLRAGDLSARAELVKEAGELGQLADAFDDMAESLQQREYERRQSEAEIIRRNRELLTLQSAGTAIASSLDLPFVLNTVAREVTTLLRVEGCTIFEWNQADDSVAAVAAYGTAAERHTELPAAASRPADCSLTRRVLFERTIQQRIISQSGLDPDEVAFMQSARLKTRFMLPMQFQDEVIGMAEIEDTRIERSFGEAEVELVQLLVNQAASAIRNAHLHAETKRHAHQLAVLHELDQAISASLCLDEIYQALAHHTGRLLSYETMFITRLEVEKLRVIYMAHQDEIILPRGAQLPLRTSAAGWVANKGQPFLRHHVGPDWHFAEDESLLARGIHSNMVLPLRVKGRVIGTWHLGSRAIGNYGPDDLEIAQALADQLAIAIENARLYEQARQEIAERRYAEAALRDHEKRIRALIEHSSDAIVLLEADGLILYASPAITRILGYAVDDWLGRNEFDWVHPEDVAEFTRSLGELAERPGYELPLQCRLRHQDGSWRQIEGVCTNMLTEPGIQAIVSNFRDVTRELQLEEQYRQAQKMEAIGRLSGGVAHDFNNLLVVINGYSELLLDRHLKPTSPLCKHVSEIKKAGERAAGLTRQLLAFSRQQVLQPEILELNDVVVNIEQMLRRLIGEDIDLIASLEPELGHVKADAGQIEQIIMNLAVNARDAMPRGGKLTIETSNVELDATYLSQHIGLEPGPYVMLAVSDTGTGMDAATQDHIFEPFFTTKARGQGTGLGLATVYGIVKQSGGDIRVYSEIGQGTTFKIYLPRLDEPEPVPESAPNLPERLTGTETVLLVEDETAVRALARQILKTRGYRVLEASNGNEALLLGEQHQEPIDLLLTDVIMPQMGGQEAAENLALLHPEMKVLYMSGYTDQTIVHHGVLEPGLSFLQKPFTPVALAQKVREVLDAPRHN